MTDLLLLPGDGIGPEVTAQVRRVAAAYHASYTYVPTGTRNYLINHTSAIFLIDRQGKLRQFFKYDESPDTLAAALRSVLDEQK